MPIANCIVAPECASGAGDLIELWASSSGLPAEQMTINIIPRSEQLGKRYTIMANLLLPSLWSDAHISRLQLGLASALSLHFAVAIDEIFVTTQIVTSGLVVEGGREIHW